MHHFLFWTTSRYTKDTKRAEAEFWTKYRLWEENGFANVFVILFT